MTQTGKFYLMSAGAIAPAFVGLLAMKMITKKSCSFDQRNILLFAGLAIAGGYITSQILKGSENWV